MTITDTTRIAIAEAFRRDSADACLEAVRAAKVKCLRGGAEMIGAHYDLVAATGQTPTVAELIEAAQQRYTPPQSQEDRYKFWRDYLLTNLRRGIFAQV